MKTRMVLIITTPSDPLAKYLLHVPVTLLSTGLEVLLPEQRNHVVEDRTRVPLNWKLRLPPGHSELLLPLREQAKERVTLLARVTDPDYQEENGLLFHKGSKEEYVCSAGEPLGHLLVLLCSVIKRSMGNYNDSTQARWQIT